MKVLKFGGSSISGAEKIREVQKIIGNEKEQLVVVFSAFKGISEKLVRLCTLASSKDRDFFKVYNEIEGFHLDIINSLFNTAVLNEVNQKISLILKELSNIVNGIYLLGDITSKIEDKVLSYGEQLSSLIMGYVLPEGELLDVKNLIKTNSEFGSAKVNFPVTNRLIKFRFRNFEKLAIVPGFIASNDRNETTTLGRGGSDYTAAIFAAALDANRLEIWTDVDGFMTADPKKVAKAFAIPSLSYAEAMELSHFGAEVIYTPNIQPVYLKNIEIVIKNTFNTEAPGTIISKEANGKGHKQIKGISSIDEVNLLTLQGPGLVGERHVTSRLFDTLATNGVNVILITQASSEYSITFAVNPQDTDAALEALGKEFEPEIVLHNALKIIVEKELSVIAIVGEQMKNTPGISAILFSSLGRNGISVIATSQGSSELNISVVIKKENLKKALNVIHEGFFLSHIRELHLYILGMGTVGKNLLEQIRNQKEKLLQTHLLNVNVIGISNSRKMLFSQDGIDLSNYAESIEKTGERADIDLFIQKIKYLNFRNSVFVDCTADEKIAMKYPEVLNSFVSVVAANKIACSADYSYYQNLKKTAREKNVKFTYETNVGAGLPIISTLNDLIRSGDHVLRIEAVLSGTLNFIFNVLSSDIKLSKAVRLAKEKGYSEPDPRIDLSGIDVARKLLILAREAGYILEKEDISVNPILPESFFEGTVDDFWKNIEKADKEFEKRWLQLEKEKKKLRYVALLDDGKAMLDLKEVDHNHPAYNLEDSNNIILITTERYKDQPMIIRGYGAGAEVTAAGVFADIIRVANV